MRVFTCGKCGNKYETDTITGGLCPDCLAEYRDKYHMVRDYLWQHPGSTASVIADTCGVSVHQVMAWVKEDRFMVTADSKVQIYCEGCGAKIISGRYCERCKAQAERKDKELENVRKAKKKAEAVHGTALGRHGSADDGRMRFL